MKCGSLISLLRSIILLVMLVCFAEAAPLAKIENCTLIKTDWADGDSFQIQIPFKAADKDGPGHKERKVTIRLYGADCLETKIYDTTDGRRLRAQRRYFGITYVGNTAESIALAKDYGAKATEEARQILSKPFTVYTSFADARGSAKYKRYYGFVITSDGKDLSSVLVSKGLARAFGVRRETYDNRHQDEYKAHLADLELQAAKNGIGIWKHTNWKKLPEERQAQRDEDRKVDLAIDKGRQLKEGEKIHINKASRDELMKLPGVGEATANRIIEKRPYKKPEDLLKNLRDWAEDAGETEAISGFSSTLSYQFETAKYAKYAKVSWGLLLSSDF